ncbi:hypothetical protein [Bacillus cereus]|nr:hypothetical protein [Bacillus cereus]HDR8323173.1 hypothetical protein [Bacillus cereus]HDR8328875.1 hypothetical protein [Bacillus cereus]HDR8334309.1 hypothetical protein [Bacillus cereus]
MTILEQKDVKIRKDRRCWGCARKFEKGRTLKVIKGVDDEGFFSTYWCRTCNTYWCKYMHDGDEIGFGELKSEDPEVWGETRLEVEGDCVERVSC